MAIGKRIKEARINRNLTQEELAKIVGVTKGAIANYESNTSHPKEPIIYSLMEALNVDANFLFQDNIKTKKASPIPDEAMQLAKDYTDLDFHGKRMVQIVVDEEKDRMKEEIKRAREAAQDRDDGPKVINLFVEPSAAGIAVPTMGVDYEIYELKPEDPPGAAYAVRLQGNSMEPDFPDGSIVFVNHDALRDGDVGIFSVDGGTVCKQYHQEGGVVYLFSLNRRRADADLVLFPGGNRSFVCQGRVMTRRRYPVPGRG